jgi:hypothetical protein
MDYIKLAQRTISMLSSMIESGECHTTRTREMMNNAQNGLEQLRQYNVVGRSERLPPKYTPCGGCGADNPNDRCINCFHDFGGN